MKAAKKLIEVALPLEAINAACAREKQPGIGAHPRGLHLWWARRPLAAARAVIFGQMVDDPSARPDLFPTAKAQQKERQRLFRIIEDLVKWDNTTNEKVLEAARREVLESWRRACAENADHPRAKELFDRRKLPAFHDPFAGGGAIPLEAQRLGLEAYASDLNPVAVLINKAMIEIPPRFAGKPPVNPDAQKAKNLQTWKGAQGLAGDVRYYGEWMRQEVARRIGHLYPKIEITEDMTKERKDLKALVGQRLTVIAWIWARTVRSPNPAFAKVDVPLASNFMLSTKGGKEAYVEPVIEKGAYRFSVKSGKPKDVERVGSGTKLSRGANFECLLSGTPISGDYIKAEGKAGRMSSRLMAIIAEGERGRIYLSPTPEHEAVAKQVKATWKPDQSLPDDPRNFWTVNYGLTEFGDLFTPRQLVALTTFSDVIGEMIARVREDAKTVGMPDDASPLRDGGRGATAYAEALAVYLSFAIDRLADYNSSIATWKPSGEQVMQTYKRQAVPMTWDFPESNALGDSAICWTNCVKYSADNLEMTGRIADIAGSATQADAGKQTLSTGKVVSTDPPYYDNIAYADLSDFFYVWLRRSLRSIFPDLFGTVVVPKAEELVATPYRHGTKEGAESFFLNGMTEAMRRLAQQAHPAFPVTIYYAFKQSETEDASGVRRTGWETFLEAVIRAGFSVSGTWPIRTELLNKVIALDANVLASSIVLVCRERPKDARPATRGEFVAALRQEMPEALRKLQAGNIAPVDLEQAAIGPGMAIFTRFLRVVDAGGEPINVGDAYALIIRAKDEALTAQEGDFEPDTCWAITWFEQHGFGEGPYGVAETLCKANNTSVAGLVEAGIVASKRNKVRLLEADELPEDWDPATDARLTTWENTHHLIRALKAGGERAAAELLKKIGAKAEAARELAYRLFTMCERRKRAADALTYNGLVQSWPEISRLAREGTAPKAAEAEPGLF